MIKAALIIPFSCFILACAATSLVIVFLFDSRSGLEKKESEKTETIEELQEEIENLEKEIVVEKANLSFDSNFCDYDEYVLYKTATSIVTREGDNLHICITKDRIILRLYARRIGLTLAEEHEPIDSLFTQKIYFDRSNGETFNKLIQDIQSINLSKSDPLTQGFGTCVSSTYLNFKSTQLNFEGNIMSSPCGAGEPTSQPVSDINGDYQAAIDFIQSYIPEFNKITEFANLTYIKE